MSLIASPSRAPSARGSSEDLREALPKLDELLKVLCVEGLVASFGDRVRDPVVLFRTLLLARCLEYGVDRAVEKVRERMSFQDFCGLSPGESGPEPAEIRSFRQRIAGQRGRPFLRRRCRGLEITERQPRHGGDRPLLSIVSPVYRAEAIVDQLVERVNAEVGKVTPNYEIVLVDDGSPDGS